MFWYKGSLPRKSRFPFTNSSLYLPCLLFSYSPSLSTFATFADQDCIDIHLQTIIYIRSYRYLQYENCYFRCRGWTLLAAGCRNWLGQREVLQQSF